MANTKKVINLAGLSHFLTNVKEWVNAQIKTAKDALEEAIGAKANSASPNLTGTPTAPTAEKGTNTTQIATTAFVKEAVDSAVLEGVGSIDLSQYPNAVPVYNSATKKIDFYHDSTVIYSLDATPFIKDGMVNNIEITEGSGSNKGKQVLKVTFNTDAGKDAVEIPLAGIFDPSNYYTSEQVDDKVKDFATNSDVSQAVNDATKDLVSNSQLNEAIADFVTDEDIVFVSDTEIDGLFAA